MATDARIAIGLPSHPKTKKLIRRLGPGAGWSLVCLILWAAANRSDGDLSGLTDEDLELASDWDGEPGSFIGALRGVYLVEGSALAAGLWEPGKESFGRVCSKTWRKVRLAIFGRDGWACTYCGAMDRPLECDHIVAVSRGGSNDPSNLTTACRPCNRSKRDKSVGDWRGA